VKQNGRIFFYHFFSGADSVFALYPLVEDRHKKADRKEYTGTMNEQEQHRE
jgi:hypothetical protein